ncbi:hypothetical protein ON010_g1920 [Phytophthora cinnamomi]|nr:hypothetical protein ON010_g1920 [Phytophthora cinnamomi]
MKDTPRDLNARQRVNSRSNEQIQVQHFPPRRRRRRSADGKYSRKTTSLLVVALVVAGFCVFAMMVQGVGDVEDLIYSSRRELRRRLAEVSSGDTVAKLHLDERYAFDGTHSDFAQQFYRRYLAGDEAEPITDTSDLAEVVKYVKDEFGLNITELPAILQQAVVWDMGYVAAADLGYVKVYTKCGVRIVGVAGYAYLCAATNGITPVHGSMWADGGTDDMVPVSNMQRHEWTDAGINYTIMAIHLAGDPNRTADESDWCSPKHGEIVPQWLELEKTGRAYVTESSGWQKAALPVTITSLVLLLLVLIAGFAFWRKTREKLREIEDILEQKRAILGGRGSDELSMVDDIDFILDTSVVEKDMGQQAWEAWKPLPVKPKQINRNSEDYDTVLLRGSFEGLIDTNDHEGSAHHRHLHNSIRSPSKATTAGLTSFASGGTGSRRDSLTLTFTRQSSSTGPVNSSSSTNPSSGTMITPLIEFQNDLAVSTRRVPFVDVSLVRQITAGAYGEVWLGRMRGDIVAVKRLTRERRRHLHELELFAAEIQLMASFAHSNVLGLLGVAWNTLENMLLIMEYVERGDLQHVLQYHNDRVLEEKVFDATNEFSWASHKGKLKWRVVQQLLWRLTGC